MKVYRCTFYDPDMGATLTWFGNKRDAESYLREMQDDRDEAPTGPEGIECMDILTTKPGLLAWLNDNVQSDNG